MSGEKRRDEFWLIFDPDGGVSRSCHGAGLCDRDTVKVGYGKQGTVTHLVVGEGKP